jgi:hypothetical protein
MVHIVIFKGLMNLALNKYWILVSILIIGNIFIYKIFSKHLEAYVIDKIVSADINN